jgi:3-oxoacyl-[acyl-carrier-protein] synthase III
MSPPSVGLLGLGGYLPARVMTNADWAARLDTSDAWITQRTGIRERRIAAADETTVDLAAAAAQVALADAGMTARDVDEIIVASDTPEAYSPDTAAFVQHRLGAREIPAFDLGSSGCAGFLLGLDVARARIGGSGRKALVIGVELLTRLMDWEDRDTCVLFGDAAGAAVVGAGPGAAAILAATAGTDGSRADILGCEVGGTRRPFTLERAQAREHQRLTMKGREVFREAVTRMTAASREVLSQAGLTRDDVALVVPHQANLRIIQAVAHALELPSEKVFTNVQDLGNTGSASVPVALWQARAQGRVAPGDVVLLTAFGAGFHWAALLLRFQTV